MQRLSLSPRAYSPQQIGPSLCLSVCCLTLAHCIRSLTVIDIEELMSNQEIN